jgi:hypothetical protein
MAGVGAPKFLECGIGVQDTLIETHSAQLISCGTQNAITAIHS